MISEKQIEETLIFQRELLEAFKKEARFFPEGTLNFVSRKTRTELFHCVGAKKTRIYERNKEEFQYANIFRRKKCTLSSIRILEKNVKALEVSKKFFKDYDPCTIYENMPSGYETLAWIFDGIPAPNRESLLEAIKGVEYEPGTEGAEKKQPDDPPFPENLKITTSLGYKVRSKSEALIVNTLSGKGMKFRYEQKVIINGHVRYPDFVFDTKAGRLIIWEHLGLSDNPEYMRNTANKLADYLSDGYEFGKTLFITSETSEAPIDLLLVNQMAEAIKSRINEY